MSNTIPRMLVDTFIWLQFVMGDERLSPVMRALMDGAARKGKLFLSALSCAEVVSLTQSGALALHQSPEKWLEKAIAESGVLLVDIDRSVAVEMEQLPKSLSQLSYIEKGLIATARIRGVTLLSTRPSLLSYAQTGFVKIRGEYI